MVALLSEDPRPPAATQLVGGMGEWRFRTGDYRVIDQIYDDGLVMLVVRVGHRPDAYLYR